MTRRRVEDDFHRPTELPLFAGVPARMVGSADRPTSLAAADAIAPRLTDLQHQVLMAFVELWPMTDYELENLKRFEGMAPSTIRKRRGELVRAGLVEACGTKASGSSGKSSMTIHRARQVIVDKLKRTL